MAWVPLDLNQIDDMLQMSGEYEIEIDYRV